MWAIECAINQKQTDLPKAVTLEDVNTQQKGFSTGIIKSKQNVFSTKGEISL